MIGAAISVVVIAYNIVSYIDDCLRSINRQSLDNVEVLVIDDGSNDGTEKICDQYGEQNHHFRVIHQKNQGRGAARNTGIREAKGDWLFFVDGDDLVEKDFFQKIDVRKYNDYEIVFLGYSEQKEDNTIIRKKNIEKTQQLPEKAYQDLAIAMLNYDSLHKSTMIPSGIDLPISVPWGSLYRKDFLNQNNLWFHESLKRSQDTLFNFNVYLKKPRCVIEPYYCYIYRHNPSSVSRSYNPEISQQYALFYQEMEKSIQQNNAEEQYAQYLPHRAVKNFLVICKQDFCNKNNPEKYSERERRFLDLIRKQPYREAFKEIDLSLFRQNLRIVSHLCKTRCFFLCNMCMKLANKVI